jgi:hypothetical protein
MIRIDRERYLKHTITDLKTLNEPSSTDFPMLGNYSCDSYFENFSPLSSDVPLTQNSEKIFQEELPTSGGINPLLPRTCVRNHRTSRRKRGK